MGFISNEEIQKKVIFDPILFGFIQHKKTNMYFYALELYDVLFINTKDNFYDLILAKRNNLGKIFLENIKLENIYNARLILINLLKDFLCINEILELLKLKIFTGLSNRKKTIKINDVTKISDKLKKYPFIVYKEVSREFLIKLNYDIM